MVEIELLKRDGSDLLTIIDDDIVSLNATLTNTGVATFRATISGDRGVERRAQRQDRVNIKTDDTKFAGYLLACPHTRSDGTTQIRGKGIAKKLQEGRPDTRPVVYDNVFAGDAIEDYWSRTPFGNVTVTKQDPTIVVQDSITQSADTQSEWEAVASAIDPETPVGIENGSLQLLQSAFTREAEDFDSAGGSGPSTISRNDFSDGSGINFNEQSDEVEFEIDIGYEIPNGELDFYFRAEVINSGDYVTFDIFDENNDSIGGGLNPPSNLGWGSTTLSSNTASEFSGPTTLTLKPIDIQGSSFGEVEVDVVAPLDNTFNYFFDNTLNELNGYLNGPGLYKFGTATTDTTDTTRNIASATVDVTIDSTVDEQRLGLSNDGGATFTRDNNTTALTANFSDAGRQLVTEFRLAGYETGNIARDATPRFNYLGQSIDSFETKVDLDDRVVFVGVEVSKNHFENLQKLHDNSDFVWTIEHDSSDPANMPVFSFPRGEETRTLDQINDNEIDESPAVEAEQFYNVIALEGGLDSQGNRPFAEVKDQDSINDIGEEIPVGLLRDPTISSDIEAQFIAQALLKKAVANGQLRGTKTIPPTFAPTPGFAYPVSWLDDPTTEVTLEEVSVTKSTEGAQTTLDFTGRSGFAQQIDELRRQARETQDEI